MTYVSRPNLGSTTSIGSMDATRRYRVGRRLRAHLPVELHRTIDSYTNGTRPNRASIGSSAIHLRMVEMVGQRRNFGGVMWYDRYGTILAEQQQQASVRHHARYGNRLRRTNRSNNLLQIEENGMRDLHRNATRHLRAQIRLRGTRLGLRN